ncbi:acyclic terpene utilization AtuA family protein [Roseinatronobacter sp. S2]|uniref:acyclic terpene utilization AtuA family protein n=1 Tax=Roseinatronobacter sp. S2 TaxID=3035471 RepID=UPI00358E15D5
MTNIGAANPFAAAEAVRTVLRDPGLHGMRVAAISGDDVLAEVKAGDHPRLMRQDSPCQRLAAS